jgi:hypothetical protein
MLNCITEITQETKSHKDFPGEPHVCSPNLVCAISKNSKGEVISKMQVTDSNSSECECQYITTGDHD